MSVKRTNLSHSMQLFNTHIRTVAGGRSTVLVWSRLNATVELSTRYTQRGHGYTTPDTTVEIGSTSATVE